MSQVVTCRSPQEIADDIVMDTHNWCVESLNAICAGRCLYIGKNRERLLAIKNQAEELMMQDMPVSAEQARKLTILKLGFFVR